MARPLRFGEPTEPLRFRLPVSKSRELNKLSKKTGMDCAALVVAMIARIGENPAHEATVHAKEAQLLEVQAEFQRYAERMAREYNALQERYERALKKVRWVTAFMKRRHFHNTSADAARRLQAMGDEAMAEIEAVVAAMKASPAFGFVELLERLEKQRRRADAASEADHTLARLRQAVPA